ncbi:hypothetical protein ACFX1T_021602 [Malus domestica]
MKKVHIVLGIPFEYREWRWLLSHLHQENGGLPPKKEIKRIKTEALARPINVVELAAHEGRKKRSSLLTQEMSAEKKPQTSSTARESLPVAPKLMINLTSSKGEKKDAAGSVLVTYVVPKVASLIADKIAQRRSFVLPPVLKFMPKCPSGAKSGSLLEKLATMKSDKVDSASKMVPKPYPLTIGIDLSAEKNETARAGSCEKSTKSVLGKLLRFVRS